MQPYYIFFKLIKSRLTIVERAHWQLAAVTSMFRSDFNGCRPSRRRQLRHQERLRLEGGRCGESRRSSARRSSTII